MTYQHRLLAVMLTVAVALLPLVASAQGAPAQAATAPTDCPFNPTFDRTTFSNSARVDNKWLPLQPGYQFTLEGRASRDNRALPHKVIFTVTDLVKVVDGVRSVVLWDVDVQAGRVAEAELAFHAQDDTGNVWMLGEYPEEYSQSGKFAGAPRTWIVGLSQTRGGWGMIADPKLGGPRYLQASSPPIGFLDCAQVFAVEQRACVPVACYDHVMITDENSPLASGRARQRKYYAPGVGNIQISAVDDPEAETLVLTSLQHLGPAALAHARGEALKLEQHAFSVNDVYRRTPPMELPAGVTLAESLALATSGATDNGPILHVGNPNKGDMIIPGSLVMTGVAFDDSAETGLGVDRVSVFLGDRELGGKYLGEARLGGHNVVTDDPQFATGGWRLITPPLRGAGQHDELFVYARSTVNGAESVVNIPIVIGDHVGRAGQNSAGEE
jgi:hypothetical protein